MPLEICESDTSGVHCIHFHSIAASGLGELQRRMVSLTFSHLILSLCVWSKRTSLGLTYFLIFQKVRGFLIYMLKLFSSIQSLHVYG